MKQPDQSIRWNDIDLVIFDMDGTLYDQRRLRMRMALNLLLAAIRARSFKILNVLRTFRQCREVLADQVAADFMDRQFEDTAMRCDCSVVYVREVVDEWIERRPLAYLGACRHSGVAGLFDALRHSGRTIAVYSDYPAAEKLKALALKADFVVSAADSDVQRMKPDPAGLRKILGASGVDVSRSLMVGDRFDRDWAVADRVGMPAIIKSARKDARCGTFQSYHDALFLPVVPASEQRSGFALPNFEECVHAIADTLIRQELTSPENPENAGSVATYVLAAHARMPDYFRLAIRALTVLFDAWSFPVTGKPFHQLSPVRRADQLKRWQDSRLQIRSALISFYRTLTFFGLYSQLYRQDVEPGSDREHH